MEYKRKAYLPRGKATYQVHLETFDKMAKAVKKYC